MSDISDLLAVRILDRLGALSTDAGFDLIDGGILKSPSQPFVSFFAGIPISEEQRFCDARPRLRLPITVMVVNSAAQACRDLAKAVADGIDDSGKHPTDGVRCSFTTSSGLITEDQVEGDWRYSITSYFDVREA